MTYHDIPSPPFPASLYEPWCRLWLKVFNNSQTLAQWLSEQSHTQIQARFEASAVELKVSIETLLARMTVSIGDPKALGQALGQALAYLHELEHLHPRDPSVFLNQPREVTLDGLRYVLLPPIRMVARPDAQAGFSLSGDLAINGMLSLDYRWQPLQSSDVLDWRVISELDALNSPPSLRIGLAPFASADDMSWNAATSDARSPDGRVPIRCGGANHPEVLKTTLTEVLQAALEQQVQVLLLPELVVDDELLQHCRDWLRTCNARRRQLRLVVAGSRHCDDSGSWVNRCTVLGPLGNTVWEQDKRSPFVIDDPATLETLAPNVTLSKVFEPARLGQKLVLAETDLGRWLTPICLDYIEGRLWAELGADFYLVPAMSPGISRFKHQAQTLGGQHGAATLVCNAQTEGSERYMHYLPTRRGVTPVPTEGTHLFTVDVNVCV